MRLWIVRHAIAADVGPPSWSDSDRTLTAEGRAEFRGLGDISPLESNGRRHPDESSRPARQTATILAEEMGLPSQNVEVTDLLRPGFDLDRLVRHLATLDDGTVAVVGHQPDLGLAASQLVAGGKFAFGKGHIAALRFDDSVRIGNAALSWFVGPEIAEPIPDRD